MIGKRKRDTAVASRSTKKEKPEEAPAVEETSEDVFRKFFESQFLPIEEQGNDDEEDSEEDGDDDEEEELLDESEAGSDWDGISGDEDEPTAVEVVEYTNSAKAEKPLDKKARKAFMTAKPPSFSIKPTTKKSSDKTDEAADGNDADNLKNDLALQRLLKESHLLESAEDLAPTGKNRLKALDLRMQSLGAKSSLYSQKMPSAHRRGIKEKADKKEEKRRLEAKENGIILEKPTHKSAGNSGRRERGVGGSSIGKFAGGTLNLSKNDLSAMQSLQRSSRGRRGGSRGGRGGRGGKRGRR